MVFWFSMVGRFWNGAAPTRLRCMAHGIPSWRPMRCPGCPFFKWSVVNKSLRERFWSIDDGHEKQQKSMIYIDLPYDVRWCTPQKCDSLYQFANCWIPRGYTGIPTKVVQLRIMWFFFCLGFWLKWPCRQEFTRRPESSKFGDGSEKSTSASRSTGMF